MIRNNPNFFKYVCFGDETSVSNRGLANHQSARKWSEENLNWVAQVPLQHRWKISMWAGIVADRIIGPYYFDDILNSANDAAFIEHDLDGLLQNIPRKIRDNMWWQQDGPAAHTSRIVREILNRRFPNRWIGLHGPICLPPRSPDHTPLDFFLWGRIKDIVFRTPPTTKKNAAYQCCVSRDNAS